MPKRSVRFTAIATAAAAAIGMAMAPAQAGPGHSGAPHGAPVGKPGDPKLVKRIVTVTMNDDMRFVPDRIDVRKGETVRFVVRNIGTIKHEMVLGTEKEIKEHADVMLKFPDMEHEDENAVTVHPGLVGELVWQFTSAGPVTFACLVPGHYDAGMVGQLRVRP
ncbi:MAG: cupredoxin family protein [Alphaproteobacteria bacterium]|nr:cupredoxin family protein [Alphaproteobacteria bacterium]